MPESVSETAIACSTPRVERPLVSLMTDVVHLWIAEIDGLMLALPMLKRTLSPDEIDRARRFHSKGDGDRYVAARGALRMILARYTGCRPQWLRFCYGPHGKPMLDPEGSIRFNLSHSGGLVLYAVARGREVGVDVERICGADDLDVLAEHFFSTRENAVYGSLPVKQRQEAFFACWTRKEAFVKARGDGLSLPLTAFDVEIAPDKPAAILRISRRYSAGSQWTMHDVASKEGYKAAIVVEGSACRLVPIRFTDRHLQHS